MATKSLFFNALPNSSYATGYDRNYNADDISDWLAAVFDTGVVKDGLKVEYYQNMQVKVNTGRAGIKGKAFINDSAMYLTVDTAPTSGTRYDYVVVKFDNSISARTITIEYRKGTSTIPTSSVLQRTENIYELMLCYIEVGVGVTTIQQSNIKDMRGNQELCPWFVPVKGYADYYDGLVEVFTFKETVAAAKTTITTDIATSLYNTKYCTIEVYTNGIREVDTAYTINTTGATIAIVFTAAKSAGSVINVKLIAALDGENLPNNSQLATLTNNIALFQGKLEFTYMCNGTNDNVLISNLVKTFLAGGNDYNSMRLSVVGNIGMTAPAQGGGTSSSPYAWFDFSTDVDTKRNVVIDFSNCKEIAPTITAGTYNQIFKTKNIHIVGANIKAIQNSTDTVIRVIENLGHSITFDNCRFYIDSYKDSLIALRGTFNNCKGEVLNKINNSYCFMASSTYSVLKINGGEYYAYAGDVNKQSAIVAQSGADAISILYGVNAPTVSKSGYRQTNSLLQWAGGGMLNCTDLISALPLVVVAGISNIRGTIALSKTNIL